MKHIFIRQRAGRRKPRPRRPARRTRRRGLAVVSVRTTAEVDSRSLADRSTCRARLFVARRVGSPAPLPELDISRVTRSKAQPFPSQILDVYDFHFASRSRPTRRCIGGTESSVPLSKNALCLIGSQRWQIRRSPPSTGSWFAGKDYLKAHIVAGGTFIKLINTLARLLLFLSPQRCRSSLGPHSLFTFKVRVPQTTGKSRIRCAGN